MIAGSNVSPVGGEAWLLDPLVDLIAQVWQDFCRIHRDGLGDAPRGRAELRRNRWLMALLPGVLAAAFVLIWWY